MKIHPGRLVERRRLLRSRVAAGRSGVVATASPPATEVALSILRSGGNAADAAVAAAWALAVCEPSGSGLGGHTSVVVRSGEGEASLLDGHSFAPRAVSLDTVGPAEQRMGYRACTVPSTPAILGRTLESFGRLDLPSVLAPAIRLAREGFEVTPLLRRQIRWCRAPLASCGYAADVLLHDGAPPSSGRRIRQPVLARTLERLAAEGTQDFYVGGIARRIDADMRRNEGLLTRADLEDFSVPTRSPVLSARYRDYTVLTPPPPAGGLLLVQALRVFERLAPVELRLGSAGWYLTIAGVVREVFRDRARQPPDPLAWTPELQETLAGDRHVARLARRVRRNTGPRLEETGEAAGETTHLCVADERGMVVSLTQSIQSLFGAKVANPELGFFYNNYLCTCPRRPHPHALASRATPRSNVAPTIAVRDTRKTPAPDDRLPSVIALGAAGSRRITSALLQVLANRIERGMSLFEAIDAPRLHPMLNGKVLIERRLLSDNLVGKLRERFGETVGRASRSYSMGAVQAIERQADDCWMGAAEPRREGTAGGF